MGNKLIVKFDAAVSSHDTFLLIRRTLSFHSLGQCRLISKMWLDSTIQIHTPRVDILSKTNQNKQPNARPWISVAGQWWLSAPTTMRLILIRKKTILLSFHLEFSWELLIAPMHHVVDINLIQNFLEMRYGEWIKSKSNARNDCGSMTYVYAEVLTWKRRRCDGTGFMKPIRSFMQSICVF